MIEEATHLSNYLPVRFKDTNEQEYIEYLWNAFESNYVNQKYQFSFISYHMLFMSFVYFNIWQVKSIRNEDFDKIKLGFNEGFGNAKNPFGFSKEGERRVLDLLKYTCSSHSDVKALIGNYKKLVDERNDIAHANGTIPFKNVEYLTLKINDILKYASEIQEYSKPIIQECFEKFLIESQDEETRQYFEIGEQINEALIHENYLSQKDIEYCLEYDISKLSSESNFREIERIYDSLKNEYEIEVS